MNIQIYTRGIDTWSQTKADRFNSSFQVIEKQMVRPSFSDASSLSDRHPANSSQEICRISCSHAGDAESWLGRSRLVPNCAFESCWELRVTTGLHAVWGHSSGRATDGIQPSRVSLMCRSKGHRSYASAGWVMATSVEAAHPQPEHFCIFFALCVHNSPQISSHTFASVFTLIMHPETAWSISPMLSVSLSLSISFIPASPSSTPPANPCYFHPTHIRRCTYPASDGCWLDR